MYEYNIADKLVELKLLFCEQSKWTLFEELPRIRPATKSPKIKLVSKFIILEKLKRVSLSLLLPET